MRLSSVPGFPSIGAKKHSIEFFALGVSATLLPAAASAGITITPGPVSDAAFECLKGIPSESCSPPAIQENWVAEGRIGGITTFEQGIIKWTSNTTNITPVNSNNAWTNGTAKPFTVKYLTSDSGNVDFTLDGITISQSNLTRTPPITTLYLRAASSSGGTSSATELTDLFIDLLKADGSVDTTTSLGNLSSFDGSRNYITVDGIAGNFQVRGNSKLSWSGFPPLAPNQSALAWELKAAYKQADVSVPGPLPILGGLAAFGWSRKFRKRIQHAGGTIA